MEGGWKTPKGPTAGMVLGEPMDPCFIRYAPGEMYSGGGNGEDLAWYAKKNFLFNGFEGFF